MKVTSVGILDLPILKSPWKRYSSPSFSLRHLAKPVKLVLVQMYLPGDGVATQPLTPSRKYGILLWTSTVQLYWPSSSPSGSIQSLFVIARRTSPEGHVFQLMPLLSASKTEMYHLSVCSAASVVASIETVHCKKRLPLTRVSGFMSTETPPNGFTLVRPPLNSGLSLGTSVCPVALHNSINNTQA